MTTEEFQKSIREGIPDVLPEPKAYDPNVNHAPKRKDILSAEEKKLAVRNALRYFPAKHHAVLAPEFAKELETYGRIYMYRFRPDYPMFARPIEEYPAKCRQAAAIMLMIQNNLDPAVAQHPHELITYGGGVPELGAVPFGDEIPVGNDRRADFGHVFGSSVRLVPFAQGCAEGGGDQRDDDPQP